MQIITSSDVLQILRRTLDQVDPRLVDHGERVGYLVLKMLEFQGNIPHQQLVDVFVLAMLHDVGAYKTEEIDNLLLFESKDVWNHSVYGALFLKMAGPLGRLADAILFHHLEWPKLKECNCKCPELANLIHFADRVETYLRTRKEPLTAQVLEPLRESRFYGPILDLFYQADKAFQIQEHLVHNNINQDVDRIVGAANYDMAMLTRCIQMVVFAIDFRSEATVTHTITTVSVSLQLAKLMGMSRTQMQQIYFGSYFHDLGKISTPVEIVEKPGSLTTEEMRVMQNHVVKTGEIIGGYVAEPIYRIATRHHEKLDGTGYPLSLREKDLTLPEMIVAVADIISALHGRRSYKDPFPREKVIGILEQMARQNKISPQVVETAVSNYDLIIDSTEKNCRRQLEQYRNIKTQYLTLREQLPVPMAV